jgi:hypothetical protein
MFRLGQKLCFDRAGHFPCPKNGHSSAPEKVSKVP